MEETDQWDLQYEENKVLVENTQKLGEGLEETHPEDLTWVEADLENITDEEYGRRVGKLCKQFEKLNLFCRGHVTLTTSPVYAERQDEWSKAISRNDWNRLPEISAQQCELSDAYLEAECRRDEQKRKIKEEAARIQTETEEISQKPDSDPQVVEAAEFVKNMTGEILEQKERLSQRNTSLGKSSAVEDKHTLNNLSVKEICRDVQVYLAQITELVQEKIHNMHEDVRKKLESLTLPSRDCWPGCGDYWPLFSSCMNWKNLLFLSSLKVDTFVERKVDKNMGLKWRLC